DSAGAAGGHDKVDSSITYVLGAYLEDLDLSTAGVANGTGNGLDNLIIGSAAANILDGRAGADTLGGGGGNDTSVIDNAKDLVVETGGPTDVDTLVTPFDTDLGVSYPAFEYLTLIGRALIGTGSAAGNLIIGDAYGNTLTGLDGNDTLDGRAGYDTLIGGAGDDTYVVDSARDAVQELLPGD